MEKPKTENRDFIEKSLSELVNDRFYTWIISGFLIILIIIVAAYQIISNII